MLGNPYTYEPCSHNYRVQDKHAQYTRGRIGSRTESYKLLLTMPGLLKAKNHAKKRGGIFPKTQDSYEYHAQKPEEFFLQRTSCIDEVLSLLVCQEEVYNWNADVQEVMVAMILCNLSKTS